MKTRRELMMGAAAGGMAEIIASGQAPAYGKTIRAKKNGISLEEAQEVHDKCLIIDGHNDMPVETVARKNKKLQWSQRDLSYHTDIPRMKEGGYNSGIFIVGNGLVANVWVTSELILSDIEKYPEDLMLVLSTKDILRARKAGKIGIIMGIESIGHWANGELDIVRLLYRLGVRSMGVIYMQGQTNRPKGFPTLQDREDERKNAGGLIPFGFEVLKECNELGIIPDLSHINDKAFYEVLERSTRTPLMSHTAVFSLCPQWRCVTDDQIRALAARGGVMGICFVRAFIHLPDSENATIDQVVEHICHVADLVGIDHVGIGSDFDGTRDPVVPDPAHLVHLTRSMMEHGLSGKEIKKVWGENFLRVMRENIG
ncbi:MAG: dipeptidase [Candidatus Latescibacterota bacterium]